METNQFPQVDGIKSILYGVSENHERVYVYLHGAGEFGQDFEGQYTYPGFATLLRDEQLSLDHPFVIACCMTGTHWLPEQLHHYLKQVSRYFSHAQIDLIGYSRGGEGVYEYIRHFRDIRTATVINSELPHHSLSDFAIPLHVFHASQDQFTPFDTVKMFVESRVGDNVKLTKWPGDHFSIAAIALSREWQSWIAQQK